MLPTLNYRRKGQDGFMTFSDSLGIADAGNVLEIALKAARDEKSTTVHLAFVDGVRVDTSIIQLLIGLKIDIEQRGRTLRIDSATPESVLSQFRLVGIR